MYNLEKLIFSLLYETLRITTHNMPAADAANTISTHCLVNALKDMRGNAKAAVIEILTNYIRVLDFNYVGYEEYEDLSDAEILTMWYEDGVLNDKLVGVMHIAEHKEAALQKIINDIIWLETNWREIGAMQLQEGVEDLQDVHKWVSNPMNYLRDKNILD